MKCVKINSVQQAFPTEEQDRSFPCGKVATLWLSPFLHITLKSAYDVLNLRSTADIRTKEAHRPDTNCLSTCHPITWEWPIICNLKVQTLVSLSSVDINVLDWCMYDVSSWELGKVKQGQGSRVLRSHALHPLAAFNCPFQRLKAHEIILGESISGGIKALTQSQRFHNINSQSWEDAWTGAQCLAMLQIWKSRWRTDWPTKSTG